MKLTKSQRLFLRAGREEAQLKNERKRLRILKSLDSALYPKTNKRIQEFRSRRKQLIRAALDAYENEKLVAQASAYERGFCAGRLVK